MGNHSVMFPIVSNLYKDKLIPDTYLDTAINLNWITTDEKTEILGTSTETV